MSNGGCDAPSMFALKEFIVGGGTNARETRLKLESCLYYLHRQVDGRDLVLPAEKDISPRRTEAAARRCLPAHPYENASQSRIRGVGRQTRDEIKIGCR